MKKKWIIVYFLISFVLLTYLYFFFNRGPDLVIYRTLWKVSNLRSYSVLVTDSNGRQDLIKVDFNKDGEKEILAEKVIRELYDYVNRKIGTVSSREIKEDNVIAMKQKLHDPYTINNLEGYTGLKLGSLEWEIFIEKGTDIPKRITVKTLEGYEVNLEIIQE